MLRALVVSVGFMVAGTLVGAVCAEAQSQQDAYIRSVAKPNGGKASATDEIASAKALLDSGAINANEYEQLKAKALAKGTTLVVSTWGGGDTPGQATGPARRKPSAHTRARDPGHEAAHCYCHN